MQQSPINWLFVDLNFLFRLDRTGTSPELRGQPIVIVPIRVEAQTGCCLPDLMDGTTSGLSVISYTTSDVDDVTALPSAVPAPSRQPSKDG
jgi:hypothetical protein